MLNKRKFLYAGFLLLSFGLVVYMLYDSSLNVLNSDTSSDLVLAKHLAETNRLLSTDWVYSSDLRILHTQLVFAPLFWVLDSFRKVRFAGAIILVVLMWLSYAYLSRQLKMKLNTFLVSSAILVLPTSSLYATHIATWSFYPTHVTNSFLIAGLFISVCNNKSARAIFNYAKMVLFLLFCFVVSLEGIRQMLNTVFPLFLTVLVMFFQAMRSKLEKFDLKSLIKQLTDFSNTSLTKPLYTAAAALFVSFAGYWVYFSVLTDIYTVYVDHSHLSTAAFRANDVFTIFNDLLHFLGYRPRASVTSIPGLLSVLGVAVFIAIVYLVATCGKQTDRQTDGQALLPIKMVRLLFPAIFIFNTIVFLMTPANYAARYYIPIIVYLIPVLALLYDTNRNKRRMEAVLKNAAISVIVIVMTFNSLITTQNVQRRDVQFGDFVGRLTNVVNFLKHGEYAYGFATHWNANIMTEMSNDAIKVSPVNDTFSAYLYLLTFKYYRDENYFSGKSFVLFSQREMDEIKPSEHPFFSGGVEVYSDQHFTVLHFDDVRDIHRYLEGG